MSKLHVALLVGAIGFCDVAAAQPATSDQAGACKQDYAKYCVGVAPGGGRVVGCLSEHRGRLSVACRRAIDSRKQ